MSKLPEAVPGDVMRAMTDTVVKYLQGSLLQETWLFSFFLNEILVICLSW